MYFSKKVNVALRVISKMRRMSEISGGESVTIQDLSIALDISPSYLEQIFSVLKKLNYVTSQRGPGGGYKLKRFPNGEYWFENERFTRLHQAMYPGTHDERFNLVTIYRMSFLNLPLGEILG